MAISWVNGELVDDEEARVSALDHGLVVGDGVFETVLLVKSRPFALDRHIARLSRSAFGLGLEPPNAPSVRAAVEAVVAANAVELGRIRITYTDGLGPLGSARLRAAESGARPHNRSSTLVVSVAPDSPSTEGASVVVVPWTRNERGALAGLKTTSYGENVRALAYAMSRDADEAIFANTRDELCEGTGSNIFVVIDGELITPPLSSGCLDGITRALVIESYGAKEAELPISVLRPGGVDEAFLTSTIRGVQPLLVVDGQRIVDEAGPVTAKAKSVYDEIVASTPEP